MIRLLPLALLGLSACMDNGGYSDSLVLQYRVGEELKDNCEQRGYECWRWLAFKTEFEDSVDNLTTFEASLARYKAATEG
jgi:hypothetical protein